MAVPTGRREDSINKGKYPTHIACPKCRSVGERAPGSKEWKWDESKGKGK